MMTTPTKTAGSEWPTLMGDSLAETSKVRWGWINVGGIQGSLEEVLEFMHKNQFVFLVIGETWLRPADSLNHPAILIDHRYPREEFSRGRGIHGLMVLRNTQLTESSDFTELFRDEVNHTCIWFKFRTIVVGGYYLPPGLDLTICRESLLIASEYLENQDYSVYLVGDLNMRMGPLTGDTISNSRSRLWYMIEEMGLQWVRPSMGKWTIETTRGHSIVDYVFANPDAKRISKDVKIWENEWLAGSDHRVVSCDTECSAFSTIAALPRHNSSSQSTQCVWRIRSSDLNNPELREAVKQRFLAYSLSAQAMVENEIGELVWGGGLYMRDQALAALNRANEIVTAYIAGSLRDGGITERLSKPATSRFFWDSELSCLKKERDRLWQASRQKEACCETRQILMDRAAEADRLLKKTVRKRKKDRFIKFAEGLAEKPTAELLKIVSNIRSRTFGRSHASGLGSTSNDLEAYADYFSEFYGAKNADSEEDKPYTILSERYWLTYDTLVRTIEGMPNNKAPGVDGITSEIIKLGGEPLYGVLLPLYRAILRSGNVPENWNTAALHLIWKQKGRRDDVKMYRPIALTQVFRKILEKILLTHVENKLGNLDEAQGGFRKKRSTLNLALTLDTIVKEHGRRGTPCYQAFLDIKGAYDTVDRTLLWPKCVKMGWDEDLIRLLKSLFNNTRVMVRVGGHQSRKVDMGRGLLQGSILSPILFNVYINDLPMTLRERHSGVNIGGTKINSLLYADDIVLVSSTARQLQEMLRTCERNSKDHKYEFAPEKCEVIPPQRMESSSLKVTLYGQTLKEVSGYKYLGLPFGPEGLNIKKLCESGIAKAVKIASVFNSVGCNGGGFSAAVCRRILTSFIRPSMEYGMALVNLSKGQQRAVDSAWCQILRKTLSLPVTASGDGLLKVLGLPPMSFRASKLNACFMARIHDAQPDTLTAKVVRYSTEGWGSRKRKTCIKTSQKNIHWIKIKETAGPGRYTRAWTKERWKRETLERIKTLGNEREGSVASRIKVNKLDVDTFLRLREGDILQQALKKRLLLWRVGSVPGRPQCAWDAHNTRWQREAIS